MLRVIALVGLSVTVTSPAPESEQQLVQEVLALRHGPMERPTHVTPVLPGTFGDLAEPHLVALEISRKRIGTESTEQIADRRSVERGEKPTSALRPEWKQELANTTDALNGLLLATHAAGGKPPYQLSIFGVFGPDDDRYGGMTPQYAAKLAALRARLQLEAKNPRAAIETCADTLGMARDIAHASLMGQMLAHAMLKFVESVCRDAARAANLAERKTLERAIARILEGWPTLSETLHTEMLFGQLAQFFDQLSDSAKAQLPPEARLRLKVRLSVPWKEPGWFARAQWRIFGGWARQKHLEQMTAMIDAARLPPAQADAEIERIASHDFAFTLAGMNDGTESSWVRLLQRVRETRAYLVRLRVICSLLQARSALGRWPTSWNETASPQPTDPRSGLPFSLRSTEDVIVLSSPSDGARTKENLDIELR